MNSAVEIYLDNAATTAPYPEVIEAMSRCMGEGFGNASSLHKRGVAASMAVDEAAQQIRRLVGGGPWQVVFTSGGTEANNQAICGSKRRGRRNQIITSTMEHAAVLDAAAAMTRQGCSLTLVSGGSSGVLNPSDVAARAGDETLMVSIIHVANEMGTVQPVNEITRLVKQVAPRALFHVDAVQAAAQLPRLDYPEEVDMVSISSHKFHGPQGVGALLIRPNRHPHPLFFGGDQQRRLRPGTLNLPGIVGMGVAAAITAARRVKKSAQMNALTHELLNRITGPGVRQLGDPTHRAPGMAVIAVKGVRSEVLLHTMEKYNLLASAGSACHATRKEPPRALVDAGLSLDEGAIRFSLSFETEQPQIEQAGFIFNKCVNEVINGRAGL